MSDRKKLMDLICESIQTENCIGNCNHPHCNMVQGLCEHLLANGVTFQKWIPASEPPKEWKNENGDAINYQIYSPGIGIDIGNWIEPAKAWFCLGVPFKVTHWMPLPEPPQEE